MMQIDERENRLLLVDDDEMVLGSLRSLLELETEYEVHTAAGGEQALALAEEHQLDLVISDYRMPGATGLEFLSEIQEADLDVPLVMLTGYGSIEHSVAAIKAGAIDYITKPVRPEPLELAVAPQDLGLVAT